MLSNKKTNEELIVSVDTRNYMPDIKIQRGAVEKKKNAKAWLIDFEFQPILSRAFSLADFDLIDKCQIVIWDGKW